MRVDKLGVFFIFFILHFSLISRAQNVNCYSYRTGHFSVLSEEFGDSFIKRTRKFQIEKGVDIETGKKFKTKDRIIWLDECTYRLESVKIKDESNVVKNDVLIFTIIESGKEFYIVHLSNLQGFDHNIRVEVIKSRNSK